EGQKQLAEQNFALAQELSYGGLTLIESAEASFASSPTLQAERKNVLVAAARAFPQYLAQQPGDLELRKRTAQVGRYPANVPRLANEVDAAEPLYQESIRLYEGLADQFPEEFVYRQRLSETLRDHASLQARVGRLREADDSL